MPKAQSARNPRIVLVPSGVSAPLYQLGQMAQSQASAAYAVGGCVRDWLLGSARTADLDVTVEGGGLTLAKQAALVWGASLTEHKQFGTATLQMKAGKQRMDIATCRKESYSRPAAYPKVEAGSLKDDLYRRDFTINAMAARITPERFGELVDPFKGEADLRERRLRVLHAHSFIDDPSRILRGIRFLNRFGLRWEPGTRRLALESIAEGGLGRLNTGRLAREMDFMAQEPDPQACFDTLAQMLDAAKRA